MLLDECICTVHQSTDPAAMAYLGGMVAVLVRTSDVGQDGTGMDPHVASVSLVGNNISEWLIQFWFFSLS